MYQQVVNNVDIEVILNKFEDLYQHLHFISDHLNSEVVTSKLKLTQIQAQLEMDALRPIPEESL